MIAMATITRLLNKRSPNLENKICYYTLFLNEKYLKMMKKLQFYITKTRLYNFDPLQPHFYIVKLEFTGVYIIFLISAQNIDCGYSLEPPRRGGSNEYQQSMFCAEI